MTLALKPEPSNNKPRNILRTALVVEGLIAIEFKIGNNGNKRKKKNGID